MFRTSPSRPRWSHALAGLVAAAAVGLAAAPAQATIATVGSDGNLWVARSGSVERVTPAGESTDFPLAGDFVPDAIASGPGGRISLVTHDTTATPAFSLRTITTQGAWDARVVGLPQRLYTASERHLTVDTAGTSWFSAGWAPCLGGPSGTIARVAPTERSRRSTRRSTSTASTSSRPGRSPRTAPDARGSAR